ncbi:DinB family protein [Flavobacterium sp. U410]
MLISSVKNNFYEILHLLNQLKPEDYIAPHTELSNATIGEHVRHIIELYQSLVKSYDIGIVNYDFRTRNKDIQNHINMAIENIEEIIHYIDKPNKKMQLEQGVDSVTFSIETNYFRELLYNLEHSIHHQALIKVGVSKFPYVTLDHNFGVAKSTIEYRLKCAQ